MCARVLAFSSSRAGEATLWGMQNLMKWSNMTMSVGSAPTCLSFTVTVGPVAKAQAEILERMPMVGESLELHQAATLQRSKRVAPHV
jgi:hypothetical protein